MKKIYLITIVQLSCFIIFTSVAAQHQNRIETIANMKGLIAFWDFSTVNEDSAWISHFDENVVQKPFDAYLKRIGDSERYTVSDWPYADSGSRVEVDTTGPFGHALRFNRGFVFAEVSRDQFEETPLNLHGDAPFTMIAWVKFYGQRHMATGIWDEGGWNKYSGRRQAALFSGLFREHGSRITAHISATGAASYPQSTIWGSQYARERAIDGQDFENNTWAMMAMTFDPDENQVTAILNGEMTILDFTDEVVQDVYQYSTERAANPYAFHHSVYSPYNFLLKYNGYNFADDGVYEHRLRVDLENKRLIYSFEGDSSRVEGSEFRIVSDFRRNEESILPEQIVFELKAGSVYPLSENIEVEDGDIFVTRIERFQDDAWQQIGSDVERQILEGAPFTFGRALGLGSEELTHGSQIYIDGVAVFNRVLSCEELQGIKFIPEDTAIKTGQMEPLGFLLSQNYPNPFNPITHIRYHIDTAHHVRLTVFNLKGQKMTELVNGRQQAGSYVIPFDASPFPSGIYFYELKADQFSKYGKMILMQ